MASPSSSLLDPAKMTNRTNNLSFPSKIVVAAGTYDGVLAGWELHKNDKKFVISFASPVHGGSVRSLCLANTASNNKNSSSSSSSSKSDDSNKIASSAGYLLLSCGYDETLQTHDLQKRLTSSGQVRTPSDFGTPVCSSFAPPGNCSNTNNHNNNKATHCLVGFSCGKLIIYKTKDWSAQHVLAGHEGGVAALAVHPSALLALSGGNNDGKLKLWDLATGRLAHANKIHPAATTLQGRTHYDPITCIEWLERSTGQEDEEGDDVYAFCYGSHVTVRSVETGRDLLDVQLQSRINEICLLSGPQGCFVACACNDGSLPVISIKRTTSSDDADNKKNDSEERRAVMAIEPVGPVAGEERFKCIKAVGSGYLVATANSAGVVSLMDLQGAVNMILNDTDDDGNDNEEAGDDDEEEKPVHPESDTDDDGSKDDEATSKKIKVDDEDDDDDDTDVELAVDLIDSIRLGTGARITCLAAWSTNSIGNDNASKEEQDKEEKKEEEKKSTSGKEDEDAETPNKRKWKDFANNNSEAVVMDTVTLDKARSLVEKAKKIQKRKQSRKRNKT